MRTLKEYELLMEEFRTHHPNYAGDVVEWYPSGSKEIVIKLRDGVRLIYSFYGNTVRVFNEGERFNEIEDEWREVFSKRLAKFMRLKFITVDLLSQKTGISCTTISKYLNGRSTPSLHNAAKIARALDISVGELT